jgi:hypothetical protein
MRTKLSKKGAATNLFCVTCEVTVKRLLLKVVSGETLEKIGLLAIIGGLIGDALLIANALLLKPLPLVLDKSLSAFFALIIAAGVWIEHVGDTSNKTIRQKSRRELFKNHALLIEALKTFSGIQFDIGMGPNDGEVEDFIWDIEPALGQAEWKQISWRYSNGQTGEIMRGGIGMRRPALGSVPASNVMIAMHPPETVSMSKAAQALVVELQKLDIAAQIVGFNIHNANANALHILIGPKR